MNQTGQTDRNDRIMSRRDALLIFLTLLIAYVYVLPRWADWSQNSRLNLVRAVVEQQTTQIDRYVANTGDYAEFNGHSYTDKPPGLSFVGIPLYAAALPLIDHPRIAPLLLKLAGGGSLSGTLNQSGTGINTDKIHHFVAQTLLTVLTVALPAAALGSLLFAVLAIFGFSRPIRLLITLAYGLATPATAYAGNYYSHQFVAALLFGAFTILVAAKESAPGKRLEIGLARAFLFGLLCSYTVISEYPPALIVAAMGVFALFRVRFSDIAVMAFGTIPPLILMGAYDIAAFGTFLPVGYTHSALWQNQHQTGFMSVTYPHLEALWGLTFGSFRGLFTRAPWLLLALPGFIIWWQAATKRGFWWICLFANITLTLFYGSSVMWWGGFGVGPRYLVPMLPFLAIPAAYTIRVLWAKLAGRVLSIGLVIISFLLTWSETLAGQSFPTDTMQQPWIEITIPAWMSGNIARNLGNAIGLGGVASLLPLVVILLLLVAFLIVNPERRSSQTEPPVAKAQPHPTA